MKFHRFFIIFQSNRCILNMASLSQLALIVLLALLLPTLQKREMISTIANPSLLSVCERRQALVVAGDSKVEIFSNLYGQYSKEAFIISGPILRIKCLKQGFIAVATKTQFCIVDPASSSTPKCKGIKGKPLSITEQPDNNLTFLLMTQSFLQLSELQVTNYGASFNKTLMPFIFQRNIALATYVGNRQYIYISDELNLLSLYRYPFSLIPSQIIEVEDLGPLKEAKGIGNINSALITDLNGNFALIKEQEVVGLWTETSYQRGCLCNKQKFVLANTQKLAVYDFEEVKIYSEFSVNDLVDIACVSDGEASYIYLLDGSGKVVVVDLNSNVSGGRIMIYILIVLVFIIAFAAIKFVCFSSKQSLSTDLDDASRQDRENVYRELRDMNQKDVIKESN